METVKKIAVIGGGAAGMMAAGTAMLYGAEVTIFEQTDRLGKKLAITGKGRCNVTNNTSINEFLENVTKNERFLYAPLNSFDPESTMNFFEGMGVELKTERGRRVFPVSERAKDIVDALKSYSSGADVIYEKVKKISKNPDGTLSVYLSFEYPEKYFVYKYSILDGMNKLINFTNEKIEAQIMNYLCLRFYCGQMTGLSFEHTPNTRAHILRVMTWP